MTRALGMIQPRDDADREAELAATYHLLSPRATLPTKPTHRWSMSLAEYIAWQEAELTDWEDEQKGSLGYTGQHIAGLVDCQGPRCTRHADPDSADLAGIYCSDSCRDSAAEDWHEARVRTS